MNFMNNAITANGGRPTMVWFGAMMSRHGFSDTAMKRAIVSFTASHPRAAMFATLGRFLCLLPTRMAGISFINSAP